MVFRPSLESSQVLFSKFSGARSLDCDGPVANSSPYRWAKGNAKPQSMNEAIICSTNVVPERGMPTINIGTRALVTFSGCSEYSARAVL